MAKKCQKETKKNGKSNCSAASYRLKCKKTANGLSHFVMYGDVAKKDALV